MSPYFPSCCLMLRLPPADTSMCCMKTLKARVHNGRLVLDEPTELPEGTELELTIADVEDDLDLEERSALHAALEQAWASVKAGDMVPASDLLQELDKSE